MKEKFLRLNFWDVVENFYETSLEFINKWKCSMGSLEVQVGATKAAPTRGAHHTHRNQQEKLGYSIRGRS